MQKIVLYIATSLDGFIARLNDDITWLEAFQVEDEDYGYGEFMDTVGTVIMGSRTYLQSLEHPERLLKGIKTYVLGHNLPQKGIGDNVEFYSGSLVELVKRIRTESKKDGYVVGGGQVVSSFISQGLLDELRIFVVPILLKQGISLYAGLTGEVKLRLEQAIPYKTGIVELRYSLVKT
jgi:dihydrofolate reductase